MHLQTGRADGKLALSDYVMVLNGRELVDFVRDHGYKSFRGPVEIRKWPRGRLQVVVRVTGKDGKTVDAETMHYHALAALKGEFAKIVTTEELLR